MASAEGFPSPALLFNYLQVPSNRRAPANGVTTGFALRNCIINKDGAATVTLAFTV
jgi:hypothetical protein